jgi:hypothetical protein
MLFLFSLSRISLAIATLSSIRNCCRRRHYKWTSPTRPRWCGHRTKTTFSQLVSVWSYSGLILHEQPKNVYSQTCVQRLLLGGSLLRGHLCNKSSKSDLGVMVFIDRFHYIFIYFFILFQVLKCSAARTEI